MRKNVNICFLSFLPAPFQRSHQLFFQYLEYIQLLIVIVIDPCPIQLIVFGMQIAWLTRCGRDTQGIVAVCQEQNYIILSYTVTSYFF